ncbi:MAG: hypothetical protein U9N81_07865 [Bacillota bacterium]|nr:hypothetical protein [Bacillota bacterium]
MKKFMALLFTLVLAFSLAGCGGDKEPAETPDNSKPASSQNADTSANSEPEKPAAPKAQAASMIETINGVEVNFEENDVVVIKEYNGKYVDNLEENVIYGESSGNYEYTIAVFGIIHDLCFSVGEYASESYDFAREGFVDNELITLHNAPAPDSAGIMVMSFSDSNGKGYELSLNSNAKDKGIIMIKDSGVYSKNVEKGHILKATYPGDGYNITIELDKSKQVQNQPKNYMYIQYDGQKKVLLAQSEDKGEDWGNSVRNILNPMMSNDGKKLYYETDAYSRTNGAGAGNHFTHVINLATGEDEFLTPGALVYIMEEPSRYAGYFVLQGWTNSASGVVPTYWVENTEGETLVNIGESLDCYIGDQVECALDELASAMNSNNQEEQNSPEQAGLTETIHGQTITYDDYCAVVIENYPQEPPLENAMLFNNPKYPADNPPAYYNIVAFGTITNVKLKTKAKMDDAFEVYDITDELTDTVLIVTSGFPTDFSVDVITFTGPDGLFYEIPVEDMSDNMSVIKIPCNYSASPIIIEGQVKEKVDNNLQN